MSGTTAIVVADGENAAPELDRALLADGMAVRHATARELAERPALYGEADVLLVPASLGPHQVSLIAQRGAMAAAAPHVVVFPDGDLDELESCVRSGFDYVVPPYVPGLLSGRLDGDWEPIPFAEAGWRLAAASVREYERDLSIAREIQSGFLPQELPAYPGWELATRFRPALQVAGDFYDGFELVNGRRLGFVVADVCDKGVGAALFMALIRTLLRHTAEHTGSWQLVDAGPELIMDSAVCNGAALPPLLSIGAGPLMQAVVGTNRYLARNHLRQGYFATLFFGVLDPASGALLYINGGHNPPVLAHADGRLDLLNPTGPAVGMMPDSVYTLGHTRLEHGDRLLLYTDGVVEARDVTGRLFGMDRLLELMRHAPPSAEELLRSVDDALFRFVGDADQSDDITMLAVHRT